MFPLNTAAGTVIESGKYSPWTHIPPALIDLLPSCLPEGKEPKRT